MLIYFALHTNKKYYRKENNELPIQYSLEYYHLELQFTQLWFYVGNFELYIDIPEQYFTIDSLSIHIVY